MFKEYLLDIKCNVYVQRVKTFKNWTFLTFRNNIYITVRKLRKCFQNIVVVNGEREEHSC